MTTPLRTVVDCAKRLPFAEALAVADSALRSGTLTRAELVRAAGLVRGRGATQANRVVRVASGDAANPFESGLRAIVIEFPELQVEPQREVRTPGRRWHPDLVDERRRVVLEADSFTFHTGKEAHARDCVRYNALVLAGWLVLRFTWEQVMTSPAYVRSVLRALCDSGADRAA
ncbi:MAG: DUF559 domain-containing protein [Nocardioides sp.]